MEALPGYACTLPSLCRRWGLLVHASAEWAWLIGCCSLAVWEIIWASYASFRFLIPSSSARGSVTRRSSRSAWCEKAVVRHIDHTHSHIPFLAISLSYWYCYGFSRGGYWAVKGSTTLLSCKNRLFFREGGGGAIKRVKLLRRARRRL